MNAQTAERKGRGLCVPVVVMNDERNFLKLMGFARNVARRKGYHQHADDFAAEVAIKTIEGRKASTEQLFVDYLRKEYGDARLASGREKMRDRHAMQELADTVAASTRNSAALEQLCGGFRIYGSSRAILVLYYKWGFHEAEIANCYGVTESRICQRLKEIQSSIYERIKKEESKLSEEAKGALEEILREEKEGRPELELRTDQEMARRESRAMERNFGQGYSERLT